MSIVSDASSVPVTGSNTDYFIFVEPQATNTPPPAREAEQAITAVANRCLGLSAETCTRLIRLAMAALSMGSGIEFCILARQGQGNGLTLIGAVFIGAPFFTYVALSGALRYPAHESGGVAISNRWLHLTAKEAHSMACSFITTALIITGLVIAAIGVFDDNAVLAATGGCLMSMACFSCILHNHLKSQRFS